MNTCCEISVNRMKCAVKTNMFMFMHLLTLITCVALVCFMIIFSATYVTG